MVEKSAYGDVCGAKTMFKYETMVRYTMAIAFVIGSYATITTSWVLMLFGFYKDIKLCLQVVWMKIRNQGTVQDQVNKLQNLALNEIVEFHAPLSFFLFVLWTYYSPNGHLFGNIKNSYWQYEEIKNIDQTLLGMGTFFLFDFSTGVICSIILWFLCKINFWKAFVALEKEYLTGFSMILGRTATIVSTIMM